MTCKFAFTPTIVQSLQIIERVRETVHLTILSPMIVEQLRLQAQVRATHYSTQIEGNRLTMKETEQVIHQRKIFPGREKDVKKVDRYYQALQQVEKWVEGNQRVTETRIRKIHALLYAGRRAKLKPYRDGQNAIREATGEIAYMPPEAADVPVLMNEMVEWIHQAVPEYPVPVIAGIAHYQFVTNHPFYGWVIS